MTTSRILSFAFALALTACSTGNGQGGGGSGGHVTTSTSGAGASGDKGRVSTAGAGGDDSPGGSGSKTVGASTGAGDSGGSDGSGGGDPCPLDCIGGEYIVDAHDCSCRYYDCSNQVTCPGAECFRNSWVCEDDGSCQKLDWDMTSCQSGYVCSAGVWSCEM